MPKTLRVDPKTQVVGFDGSLTARAQADEHDPVEPLDGMTFGVAVMSGDAPHGGERHSGGDEVLYLIDGKARIVYTDDPEPDVVMMPGDVVIVPRGLWHRVEILEPCHLVYLTPGRGNEVRPLRSAGDD